MCRYLWDHRNESLRAFLVDTIIGGPDAMGNKNINGLFLDDFWSNFPYRLPWATNAARDCSLSPSGGPSEIKGGCIDEMGLSAQDVQDLATAWKKTMEAALAKIAVMGGYSWQMLQFPGAAQGPDPGDLTTPKPAPFFRTECTANSTSATTAIMMRFSSPTGKVGPTLDSFEQDLAAFLLIRSDYAWLGYSWGGCNRQYSRPPMLDSDFGVPQDGQRCKETSTGVFSREYTKSSIQLDTNTNKATITMKSDGGSILAGGCDASQYCASAIGRCATPARPLAPHDNGTRICRSDKDCLAPAICSNGAAASEGGICVSPGDPCTAPPACAASASYCSPGTGKCATPVSTTVCSVAGEYSYSIGSCASVPSGTPMCSAGSRVCVKYGQKDCSDSCPKPSYCSLLGQCATPAFRPGAKTPECETCTPTPIACATGSDCSGAGQECCPLTKLCVTAAGSCSRTSSGPFFQNCSSTEFCSITSDSQIARRVCMSATGTSQLAVCDSDADCPTTSGAHCDRLTALCVTSGDTCGPGSASGGSAQEEDEEDDVTAASLKSDDDAYGSAPPPPPIIASFCEQPGWSTTFVDEFDGPLNTTNWHAVEESAEDYGKCQAGFGKNASNENNKWWIAHCTRTGAPSAYHTMSKAKQVTTEDGKLVIRADAVKNSSSSFSSITTGGVTSKLSFGGSAAHGPTRICLNAMLPGGAKGSGQGFWPALWMMPDDSSCWACHGESHAKPSQD